LSMNPPEGDSRLNTNPETELFEEADNLSHPLINSLIKIAFSDLISV